MRHLTKFLLFFSISTFTKRITATHSRYSSEVKFMHCLCSVPVDYRLYKINCMERFVSPDNAFTLARSVQYCGYFAYKTNFGQTMRQGVNIQDYNPWEPASDLNTEKICGYTYIRPDIYLAPSIKAVTSKGWVISKCILNMAKIDGTTARTMLQIKIFIWASWHLDEDRALHFQRKLPGVRPVDLYAMFNRNAVEQK